MALRSEWVGLVLVLLGLLRAGVLVAHDPLMGYANQYDMIRTSACLGLYPTLKDPTANTPEAPIAEYKAGGPRSGLCYLSTEVAFDAAVMGVARLAGIEGGRVRMNWIGYGKLGLLAITALLIAFALHRHPAAALAHGMVFLLVIADPVITLWLNTLYTEFGAIWGLYASIGAACALAASERARAAMWAVLITGLLALAFSREQYALLAPVLVIASWPWLWARSSEMTVATLIFALGACLVSFTVVPRPGLVTHVNRADTYLGVMLPASSRPQLALELLKLPARCEAMSGATWYLQRGENVQQVCPEVFLVPSYAFLRFVPEEPEALARAVARVLPAMQGISPAYLGTLEGGRTAPASELPWWAFSPLDAICKWLPTPLFVALVLASMMAALLAFLAALAWARPSEDHPHAGLLVAMLLGGSVIYGLLTSVFGDGMSEAARHFMPGVAAMFALGIAALPGVPALAARWWEAPKARAMEIVAGFLAVPLVMIACVMAWRWAQTQPLGIGVLDHPAGRQGALPSLQLRGWALDPFGVDAVTIELGKIRREARVGDANPDLRAFFPGYPDNARAGFVLDLAEGDLAQAGAPEALPLRITVKSRAGAVTEIDRRKLEFPK